MEQFLQIFAQLGGDETIVYQFGLFFLIFILFKWIFLGKLQFVIEMRENKTTKLEESADGKFQKSEILFNKYRNDIQTERAINLEKQEAAKAESLAKQKATLKKVEEKIDQRVQEEREAFRAGVDLKKQAILSNASKLSKELVAKVVD